MDAQFTSFVEAFKDESASHGHAITDRQMKSLTVMLGDTAAACKDANAIGCCAEYDTGERDVTINGAYWDAVSDAGKYQVMFHELGHCLLGYAHRGVLNSEAMPTSIMYPSEFDSNYFESHINDYMSEFFSH